jgi:DNA-binding winged helix-turn-helix (wHTH) protein
MTRESSAPGLVRFGVFELDGAAGELRKQGRRINLQQQPCQVLALLLRSPGQLVTREELQQALWPGDTFVEFDQGLNTAIKKIRQALDDSADHPRFVETLPRKGYRFIAPVDAGGNGLETPGSTRALGRRLTWAGALLALLISAGAAGWLLSRRNDSIETTFVPVPLSSYPGRESRPSFSPDGNQVAFDWNPTQSFSEPTEAHADIYVKLVGADEPLRLANGCCPAWSPDGRRGQWVSEPEFHDGRRLPPLRNRRR